MNTDETIEHKYKYMKLSLNLTFDALNALVSGWIWTM